MKFDGSRDSEVVLWSFLDELRTGLRPIRDDKKAVKFSLRLICEHFEVAEGCLAVLQPGRQTELLSVLPRAGQWDLELLTAFLRTQRINIPQDIIMSSVHRRGRSWGVLALRSPQGFERHRGRALSRITKVISESIEVIDWQRIVEVNSRIDRKIMEQLRPQDLFYHILHGLRTLMHYDHSSALLICDPRENVMDLVAEQIAWVKGKSRRIGLRLPLNDEVWSMMRDGRVYAFDRQNGGWHEWLGRKSTALAELLDYNKAAIDPNSDLRESAILCAPLATRDGVLGVLKVAARDPRFFGTYEADLLQRFVPLAAVAIQNSQRTLTLEAKMLEAEKKHAVANLVRGVSHDINNALGAVLPLVQQIISDVQSKQLQAETLSEDLQQIEQSLQTCRRIFGGMLSLARGETQRSAHANVRRALDGALAIVKDGLQRQRIRLEVQLADIVPNIRVGQGDLEQLVLNLAVNARDAMPNGGVLSIKTEQASGRLEIVIRDTGCGIPPDHMSRIQEPFFTTKHNGNGLGLSICRSIVWNAGGQMKIESQPGVGTEIRVLLPFVDNKTGGSTA